MRLTVADGNGLEAGIALQALEAFFATMAGAPHPTEGQLDAACGAIVIDEHLTTADTLGQAQLTPSIAGPDAGTETEVGGIGEFQGLSLAFEGLHHQHWPEQLLAGHRMPVGHIHQQLRHHEVAAFGELGASHQAADGIAGLYRQAIEQGHGQAAVPELVALLAEASR